MANVQLAVAGDETTQVILSVPGVQGPTGSSIPPSGTTNQVLYKQSNTDYDTAWKLITNDNVDAAAAIAGTKISPNFGSQNVLTTGTSTAASFIPSSSSVPTNGLYLPSANNVALSTNGTGRLFVDSSGNVGFGVSSPERPIHLPDGSVLLLGTTAATGTQISHSASSNLVINNKEAGAQIFYTNDTERLRITSAGLVGIGTSSPQALFECNDSANDIQARFGTLSAARNPIIRLQGRNTANTQNCFADIKLDSENQLLILSDPGSTSGSVGANPVVIDSSGRVGIGTTSPSSLLHLGAASGTIQMQFNNGGTSSFIGHDSAYTGLDLAGGGGIRFRYFNGAVFADAAQVDTSGRLLVGTSTARSTGYGSTASFQLESTSFPGAAVSLTNNQASAAGPSINFLKTRGTTLGANTLVANNDVLGRIVFSGADGAASIQGAIITADVDGTPGLNDLPTRLVFSTTADGASSPTERMRITNGGEIQFGNTTNGAYTVTRNPGICAYFDRRTSDGVVISFERQGSGVGNISVTTTATAYNTSSDYRLKENVTPVADGITRLQQLKPSRFNFIADPDKTVDGFIAHEVQTIVPEAITGEKDAVDDEGNPVYQGIDQSKLVPLLTAALQEAIAKIETLEAKVAALEGA